MQDDDDISIPIIPDVDADDGGDGVVNAESSRIIGAIDDEERYGTFQRRSPQPQSPPQNRLDKTSRFRQTVSSLGFCLGALAMGNALGWSSTAVPNLGCDFSVL